ncbi:15919_t:CDS:2, partial [Cetraspora pellucida]
MNIIKTCLEFLGIENNDNPDDREFDVTIQVKNGSSHPFRCKLPNENLAEIRNRLRRRKNDPFKMGTNFEEELVKKAPNQAFEIDIDKIESMNIVKTDVKRQMKVCKNKFADLCEQNFIAYGSSSAIPSLLSLFLGASLESYKEMLKEVSTKYSCIKLRKAEIIISEKSITLTEEFKEDVKNALIEKTTREKINKLREVSKKYGHFYARSIGFGGAIIEKIVNTDTETSNLRMNSGTLQVNANLASASVSHVIGSQTTRSEHRYNNVRRVIGGTTNPNLKEWFKSLEDFRKWSIIEYDDIRPIFSLLDSEMQKEVLNALGQRVLAAGVAKIFRDPKENGPYIHSLHDELQQLIDSQKIAKDNVHDCQIFASVMNKDLRGIFSIRVEFEDKYTPLIVVHRIHKGFLNFKRRTKIGWIIVGRPENFFDFYNTEMIFRKYIGTDSERENHLIPKSPDYHIRGLNEIRCLLCTCVIEAPKEAPHKSRLIISTHTHYDLQESSARIFIHQHDNNSLKDRIKLYSSTVEGNFGQISIDWKELNKNKIYYVDFPKKDLESPILVNQLIEDCSENCQQYQGFLNVVSKKVIYGPLDSRPLY